MCYKHRNRSYCSSSLLIMKTSLPTGPILIIEHIENLFDVCHWAGGGGRSGLFLSLCRANTYPNKSQSTILSSWWLTPTVVSLGKGWNQERLFAFGLSNSSQSTICKHGEPLLSFLGIPTWMLSRLMKKSLYIPNFHPAISCHQYPTLFSVFS